jgi:hypothetical protein
VIWPRTLGVFRKRFGKVSHFGKVGRFPHFGKVQSLKNDWRSLSLAKIAMPKLAEPDFLEYSAIGNRDVNRSFSHPRGNCRQVRWSELRHAGHGALRDGGSTRHTHVWGRLMVVHSCAMMKLYTSIYWLVVWNMNGL